MPETKNTPTQTPSPTAVVPARGERFLDALLQGAKTQDERERAFALAERYNQSKIVRELSEAVAATSWGSALNPLLRAQIIRYALEIGADPTRHLYVLGGRPYLNGEFYRELVVQNKDYVRDVVDFIQKDDRADQDEQDRRLRLRIAYGAPEAALAVCIVTLHFANNRGPFVGVKWAPSHKNDPVGTEFPVLAAETRAWRKAAQKAVSPWFLKHPLLVKIEALVEAQRTSAAPERPPEPLAPDEPPIAQLAPPAASTGEPAPPPDVVRHNPSKVCDKDGEHPFAECGYNRPRPAA